MLAVAPSVARSVEVEDREDVVADGARDGREHELRHDDDGQPEEAEPEVEEQQPLREAEEGLDGRAKVRAHQHVRLVEGPVAHERARDVHGREVVPEVVPPAAAPVGERRVVVYLARADVGAARARVGGVRADA